MYTAFICSAEDKLAHVTAGQRGVIQTVNPYVSIGVLGPAHSPRRRPIRQEAQLAVLVQNTPALVTREQAATGKV